MTLTSDDELRRAAERRVGAKLGFRMHLLVYLLVNGGLIALNLVTWPSYLWSGWPMFGWGIGLIAHGLSVYGFGDQGRERMVEREMARMRRGQISPGAPASPNP